MFWVGARHAHPSFGMTPTFEIFFFSLKKIYFQYIHCIPRAPILLLVWRLRALGTFSHKAALFYFGKWSTSESTVNCTSHTLNDIIFLCQCHEWQGLLLISNSTYWSTSHLQSDLIYSNHAKLSCSPVVIAILDSFADNNKIYTAVYFPQFLHNKPAFHNYH